MNAPSIWISPVRNTGSGRLAGRPAWRRSLLPRRSPMPEHDAPGRTALSRFLDVLLGRLSRVTTSGQFIPEIDGLRFIAIALVFFAHVHAYTAVKTSGDVAPTLITR